MSTIHLEEPLTAGGIQAINFFNGRLLSGEDLTHEQAMNLLGQRRLGQTIGTGVAFGLEVEKNATQSTASNPVLTIKRGLALNRDGQTLWVQNDVELAIVRSSESAAASGKVFSDCAPSASSVSVSGDGVYLLVIAPAKEKEGKAPVSGLGNVPAACNSRYTTIGVQFRLVPLNLDPVSSSERARNEVAYQCFGLPEKQPNDFLSAALARLSQPAYGLETHVPTGRLTTHEVPLAIIQWTATGMGFVDMWAVRRRLTKAAADAFWEPLIGDRRLAEGEAMFLQFQDHSHHLAASAADVSTIAAADHFLFLPPLGILPVRGTGSPRGFDPSRVLRSARLDGRGDARCGPIASIAGFLFPARACAPRIGGKTPALSHLGKCSRCRNADRVATDDGFCQPVAALSRNGAFRICQVVPRPVFGIYHLTNKYNANSAF